MDIIGADGKPADKTYLELNLPEFLERSFLKWKEISRLLDKGERPDLWDCYFCEFQSDINCAEVSNQITSEQADYLRHKYLWRDL